MSINHDLKFHTFKFKESYRWYPYYSFCNQLAIHHFETHKNNIKYPSCARNKWFNQTTNTYMQKEEDEVINALTLGHKVAENSLLRVRTKGERFIKISKLQTTSIYVNGKMV